MRAYYDLRHCPTTFDTVTFLLRAEAERIVCGDDSLDVHIIPGPIDGFRDNTLWPHTLAERIALRQNITEAMCRMLPSVLRVTVHKSRPSHRGFGFDEYSMESPYMAVHFKQGLRPLRPMRDAPYNARRVTITLREAEHEPERNSNVSEWIKAASMIRASGYEVVFVRDTVKANEPIDGFDTAPIASLDLNERGTLYRSSFCNLFIANGPAWFAMACDAPVLMVKNIPRDWLPAGKQIPNSPFYQRLAWVDDNAANILSAFGEHVCKCA